MKNTFHNMTDEQAAEVKAFVVSHERELSKALEKDPKNDALMISACGWNQFCENLGIPGYEFS